MHTSQRNGRVGSPAGSADEAAHRAMCYACHKPAVSCICAGVEPVRNRTTIVILQHPRERRHAVGTARIAHRGLTRVVVESFTQWCDGSAVRARLPSGAALLYPSAEARELVAVPAAEQPRALVIIDGTWFHAKKVYDAHGWLRQLPTVRLTPTAPSQYRIRREPQVQYLATIEAIVAALRILEPRTRGVDGLLRCFAAMVDRQAAFTPIR